MNYTQVNLDLQSVIKRAYDNLLYRSSFMNFLNSAYLGEIRQAGAPRLEVIKQTATATTAANTPVIATAIAPNLAQYESVSVDLAELRLNYSFRVPSLVTEAGIANIIDGQIALQDADNAKEIDEYGFAKMHTAVQAQTKPQTFTWNSTTMATSQDYIEALNTMKATLFNNNVYDGYKLGLKATEYANLVSNITSLLHYETMAGVEGVDRGDIARAYGIDIFPINSNVLKNSEVGYFASEVGTVGDAYFSQFNEFPGDYPGFPGDYVVEGTILFGAEVVRPEAVIEIVAK